LVRWREQRREEAPLMSDIVIWTRKEHRETAATPHKRRNARLEREVSVSSSESSTSFESSTSQTLSVTSSETNISQDIFDNNDLIDSEINGGTQTESSYLSSTNNVDLPMLSYLRLQSCMSPSLSLLFELIL
jgi:hypothetical protein